MNKAIQAMFYAGDMPGFTVNAPCQILFDGIAFTITRRKPDISVTLEKGKVQSVTLYMFEREYMAKYQGNAASTSKVSAIPKMYFIITYDTDKHIDFWCTAAELKKVQKLQELLNFGGSYSL